MRNSTAYLLVITLTLAILLALAGHALQSQGELAARQRPAHELVGKLQLTDLCLFTEARYTRHPAMADRHTPFQDHPMALDHFPSGGLIVPPAHLKRTHEQGN